MTVLIEKKFANAIEKLREEGYSNKQIIVNQFSFNDLFYNEKKLVRSMDFDLMVKALYEGYEAVSELKPEELILKMYDDYNESYLYAGANAIEDVLDILGIKINGIN